ncbi:MAG: hypothetical protein ACRD8U_11400 [Pyrinomonadaceae bacterium]
MTSRKCVATFLLSSFLLAAPVIGKRQAPGKPPTKSAPTQKTPQKQTVAGTVIFAVNKISDGVTLDPIVIFNKGQYVDPLPDDDAFVKQVAAKYLRTEQNHRVIFGGAEAGTVIVKDRHEFGLTTGGTLQSSIKLSEEVMALATTSSTLGAKQNTRRAPTSEERAAMLKLMSAAYTQRRVPAPAIAKVQVNNITALDLDADGKAELSGSFFIRDQTQNTQSLFLIAEIENGQYRSGLTWYKKGDEGAYEIRRLIDILDLDGDGIAEVFAINSYKKPRTSRFTKR